MLRHQACLEQKAQAPKAAHLEMRLRESGAKVARTCASQVKELRGWKIPQNSSSILLHSLYQGWKAKAAFEPGISNVDISIHANSLPGLHPFKPNIYTQMPRKPGDLRNQGSLEQIDGALKTREHRIRITSPSASVSHVAASCSFGHRDTGIGHREGQGSLKLPAANGCEWGLHQKSTIRKY